MANVTVTLPNGTSVVWEVTEAEVEKLKGRVQEITGPVSIKIEGGEK